MYYITCSYLTPQPIIRNIDVRIGAGTVNIVIFPHLAGLDVKAIFAISSRIGVILIFPAPATRHNCKLQLQFQEIFKGDF